MKFYTKIIRSSRATIAETSAQLVYRTGWSSTCTNNKQQFQMLVVQQIATLPLKSFIR